MNIDYVEGNLVQFCVAWELDGGPTKRSQCFGDRESAEWCRRGHEGHTSCHNLRIEKRTVTIGEWEPVVTKARRRRPSA